MRSQCLAAGFMLAISAAADTLPPTLPLDSIVDSQAATPPASGLFLGKARINFESSTFEDARKIVAAPIGQRGDAGEFEMWVCYTLTHEKQRVWLTSSELGGHKYIDGASGQTLSGDVAATPDCPELPGRFKPVRLDRGVRLGTSEADLERILGSASAGPHGLLYFSYAGKDREYDVTSTLIVNLKGRRVNSFCAAHSTTN